MTFKVIVKFAFLSKKVRTLASHKAEFQLPEANKNLCC